MKHFTLTTTPDSEGVVQLYLEDYHYLVRVRRLKTGESFNALLPDGDTVKVRILSTTGSVLTGKIENKTERKTNSICTPPLTLFQGLPKGSKMDLIIRQAAEAGVSVIVPFHCEHSENKAGRNSGEKIKRWERIIREAKQQSGSVIETKVHSPCSFIDLLNYWESTKKEFQKALGIFFHQEPLERMGFHEYLGNKPDFIAYAIGPEGGFSQKEITLFLEAGFKPLMMGDTVLRTETAALYGTAAIKTIIQENKKWTPSLKESCS